MEVTYEERELKKWSREGRWGCAQMGIDYSFHRGSRVGLMEKVIMKQGFGGRENKSFGCHCCHVDVIVLLGMCGKALCKWYRLS